MKVIYNKTIVENIEEAKINACKSNRVIDKIILTKAENDELYEFCKQHQLYQNACIGYWNDGSLSVPNITLFNGINFEVEK